MRIVFFGTPEFAVPSLRALVGEGFFVATVVTQPDKPQGRSRSRLVPPPVKVAALDEGIPILQPERPADPAFIDQIRAQKPDIGVVVAYGHILKPELLSIPRHGMVNVHASLLPALRGAAPIQYAIMLGLEETGVSVMQMEAGLDSGPVFVQVPTPIAPDETAGELSTRLSEIGALSLIEALTLIDTGDTTPTPQNHTAATTAPKITKETARIDWQRSAEDIGRLVRAMDPTPGAWCVFEDTTVKLFGPKSATASTSTPPGGQIADAAGLVIQTGDGALQFLDVQVAGKKRMAATDWLRGRNAPPGRFA